MDRSIVSTTYVGVTKIAYFTEYLCDRDILEFGTDIAEYLVLANL